MNISLYNEDFRTAILKIPSESIDCIISDVPYAITKRGNAGTAGGMMATKLTLQGKIFSNNDIKPEEYAKEFFRVLKDGTHCYVMVNHFSLINMLNAFVSAGFHFTKSLIWDKGNKIMGRFYMSQFEYILFFRKGRGKQINNCSTSDIIRVPNIKTKINGKNIHDTEKPVNLMKILVENSTDVNDVVLDPFMGVGSTGIACKELKRNFIGIEIDKKYFNIAEKRINKEILLQNDINGIEKVSLF